MAKKNRVGNVLNFVVWLTGVLVSLSVGFAMVSGTLTLPFWLGGDLVAMVVGWIVVITTILSAILALISK